MMGRRGALLLLLLLLLVVVVVVVVVRLLLPALVPSLVGRHQGVGVGLPKGEHDAAARMEIL
jgi:hypothetical protein